MNRRSTLIAGMLLLLLIPAVANAGTPFTLRLQDETTSWCVLTTITIDEVAPQVWAGIGFGMPCPEQQAGRAAVPAQLALATQTDPLNLGRTIGGLTLNGAAFLITFEPGATVGRFVSLTVRGPVTIE